MNRDILSLLLLITYTSPKVFSSSYLSYVAGGRRYYHHSRSRRPNLEYSHYCQIEQECVCNQEGDGYVFHCEKQVHARMSLDSEKSAKIDLRCNVTIQSENLRHDYYSSLGIKALEDIRMHLIGCPEPPESYASLVASFPSHSQSDQAPPKPMIKALEIDCGLREQFSVVKEHLVGLDQLAYLTISCAALRELPGDLFQDKLPNLISLNINNTRIERIPDGLLSFLSNLREFAVHSNKIGEIRTEVLRGAISLRAFRVTEPALTSLGEDIFSNVPDLKLFSLVNSKVTILPKSLGNLANLRTISLVENSIEYIEEDHCASWTGMTYIGIEQNPIKRFDFECFSHFENVTNIRISGTSLSGLPDKPILMNELTKMLFNNNNESILKVSRFIVSEKLEELEMEDSNIESFEPDFLYSLPKLGVLRLNNNKLSSLHKDFFSRNPNLWMISLIQNRFTNIHANLFLNNPNLNNLQLSDNAISDLPSSLFRNCSSLVYISLGGNRLEGLPKNFLSNLEKLKLLNISNNKIANLEHNCFSGLSSLVALDLSDNIFGDSKMTFFQELKNCNELRYLNMKGNFFSSVPPLHIPSLRSLNLSKNNLSSLEVENFRGIPRLMLLNVSRNALQTMSGSVFRSFRRLTLLDMSFNQLREIPLRALSIAADLEKVLLSGNQIRIFDICALGNSRKLTELDLSGNGLHTIEDYSGECDAELPSVKVLNLANNEITFDDSNWLFDVDRKTWGKISPLIYFPNVEEINLANNSISTIFMDWRNMLISLRVLDLRHNKIKYLTHQDLLFPSVIFHRDGPREPIKCSHSLEVDLRHNLITGMELPKKMLIKRKSDERFANVTLLLEDNPFHCGCGVIDVLRWLDGDILITSELRRTEGLNWILPAKIEPGNLSCWRPEGVRGKKLTETETWTHHIIPTLGMCSLLEDTEYLN